MSPCQWSRRWSDRQRHPAAVEDGGRRGARGEAVTDRGVGHAESVELGRELDPGDGRAGDDEPVERCCTSSPVSVERSVAASPHHSATTVFGASSPPAPANRRRAGTSAALWYRPAATAGAAVAIVTLQPRSWRNIAVPIPRQSSTSSSTQHAPCRRRRRRPSTSCAVVALPSSIPGSWSARRSARWKPRGRRRRADGDDHMVGASAATSPASSGRPQRTSTPSRSSSAAYQARWSSTCDRVGCCPARRHCPPSSSDASTSTTCVAALGAHPRRLETGRDRRRRRAPGPASAAGVNRSPPHCASRPTDGLTRHEIQ